MSLYPESYYAASLDKSKTSSSTLNEEHSCDLCVIGGGFTGLSTAIESAKKGLKVILLEQNIIGWGAGLAIGITIGVSLNNIILGIGLGVAFGAALGHIQMKKENSSREVK